MIDIEFTSRLALTDPVLMRLQRLPVKLLLSELMALDGEKPAEDKYEPGDWHLRRPDWAMIFTLKVDL